MELNEKSYQMKRKIVWCLPNRQEKFAKCKENFVNVRNKIFSFHQCSLLLFIQIYFTIALKFPNLCFGPEFFQKFKKFCQKIQNFCKFFRFFFLEGIFLSILYFIYLINKMNMVLKVKKEEQMGKSKGI